MGHSSIQPTRKLSPCIMPNVLEILHDDRLHTSEVDLIELMEDETLTHCASVFSSLPEFLDDTVDSLANHSPIRENHPVFVVTVCPEDSSLRSPFRNNFFQHDIGEHTSFIIPKPNGFADFPTGLDFLVEVLGGSERGNHYRGTRPYEVDCIVEDGLRATFSGVLLYIAEMIVESSRMFPQPGLSFGSPITDDFLGLFSQSLRNSVGRVESAHTSMDSIFVSEGRGGVFSLPEQIYEILGLIVAVIQELFEGLGFPRIEVSEVDSGDSPHGGLLEFFVGFNHA